MHAKVARFSTTVRTTWSGARRWRASCSPACASVAASVASVPRSTQAEAPLMTKPSRPASRPSRPRSKTNCAGALGVRVQREHRLGQDAAGAVRVDGRDRLVAKRRRPRRPTPRRGGRPGAPLRPRSRRRRPRSAGAPSIAPRAGRALEPIDAVREADRRAGVCEPGQRRRREHVAEAGGAAAAGRRAPALPAERHLQDAQEHRAARFARRRVQRGDAQAAR